MEKEFIPYKQALALKELGFNEPCFAIYYSKNRCFSWHHHKDHTNDESVLDSGEYNISAPPYQQTFRWFREKYELYYTIEGSTEEGFQYFVYTYMYKIKCEQLFNTYEEAELECLEKLIEIVKNER